MHRVKGNYYAALHMLLALTLCGILVFSRSLVTLSIGVLFLLADMVGIMCFRGCPLTFMEQYYLNDASASASRLTNGVSDPDWKSLCSVSTLSAEIEHVIHVIVLYFLKMALIAFMRE